MEKSLWGKMYLQTLLEEIEQADVKRVKGGLQWAKRSGELRNMSWDETQKYLEWINAGLKDARVTTRIPSSDLMKIRAFARMKGKRYMTYVRELLTREIRREEERLAEGGGEDMLRNRARDLRRNGDRGRVAGREAGAPR